METSRQGTKQLIATDTNSQQSYWRRFGKTAAIYGGGAVVVGSYVVPAIFAPIGFTSVGITTGSLAAKWQALEFLPGAFSAIQSATATNAIGALIAKVGAGAGLVKAYYKAKDKDNQNEMKIGKKPRIRSKL